MAKKSTTTKMRSKREVGPKSLSQFVEDQGNTLGDEVELTLNEDGSVDVGLDVDLTESDSPYVYSEDEHYSNLVTEVDEDVLDELSLHILATIEQDEQDRSEWLKTIEFGLDLLGLKVEEKHVPFQGACSAQHPLLMESAVKFQSKASNELLPSKGPVKTSVLGDTTTEKEEQALRVQKHLNYQITEEMTEFFTDAERMLLYVPLVGSGFKKTYYDAHLERAVSEFVPADQVIVPNSASDLFRSPRYTHILYKTDYEFDADCEAGLYTKPDDLGSPTAPELTEVTRKTNELIGVEVGVSENSNVYTLFEQHVECYIEGLDKRSSEYKLSSPYIVTIENNSKRIVGIRRNWKRDDNKRTKKVQFTHYGFVPGFGFYSFGYLHLLGNLQLSLTSSLRSLVDAGQFANLQGGFKLKGVRIVDDGDPIMPGQFKDIEAMTQDISKAIMPLPFKGADQTLYQMLEFLDTKGQKFADSTEQVIADSTNYGPVGTTMALLDASTKFFSAIHKRLHNSLKQELRIIASINAETLPDSIEYNLENETMQISRADYDERVDVVPVSDPNISSNSHRMAKAQTLLQVAQTNPEQHDMREVLKHFYINMDYANVNDILPPPEEAGQNDPMTDIQFAQSGKPIKAFEGQDHQAHIALKQAFMQDPMSGANPMMQKVAIALQANIQEHMLLNFIEQAKAQSTNTGSPIQEAAAQIAQMNQQQIQQEQENAQLNPKDQASMLIAQSEYMDTQTEARKQKFDELHKTADLELKKEKIDLDLIKELRRMDEFDKKLLHDMQKLVQTKGLDSMIAGLSQQVAANQEKDASKEKLDTK